MELKDVLALYVSGFAALVAVTTLAYQWWRDYLSTVPVVVVMVRLAGSALDVALYNKRNPTVILKVGICMLAQNGKLISSEILSETFHVIGEGGSMIVRDILNTGVPRELEIEGRYKVYVEVVGGRKFYSSVFYRVG